MALNRPLGLGPVRGAADGANTQPLGRDVEHRGGDPKCISTDVTPGSRLGDRISRRDAADPPAAFTVNVDGDDTWHGLGSLGPLTRAESNDTGSRASASHLPKLMCSSVCGMHDANAGIDPNWIIAITGVLTFITAVVAATYAAKAARRGREQVVEARKQTEEAHAQAEAGKSQADLAEASLAQQTATASEQHQALLRSERRAVEARVDARMPTVIAEAHLPNNRLEVMGSDGGVDFEWRGYKAAMEYEASGITPNFRQHVDITIRNVSTVVARVDVVHPAGGEIEEVPSGTSLVFAPGESLVLHWHRVISGQALQQDGATDDPRHWLFNLRLWVRDLGMEAHDVYLFNANLRYFRRNGSRLMVTHQLENEWPGNVNTGTPVEGRVYDRLDVGGSS